MNSTETDAGIITQCTEVNNNLSDHQPMAVSNHAKQHWNR